MSSFRGQGFAVAPRRAAVVAMSLETIQTQIQEEMKKAQEATAKFGKESKEAAMAWDIVEELEAKASDMKQPKKDPLEEFCEDVPEADECRTYDN